MLRILRTCVNVEMAFVSGPLFVWKVAGGEAREIPRDEIEANLQYVDEWEQRDQEAFLEA